ncbi:MAG: hypothetical protein WCV85_06650 [Patescibacteria group bacterium]|jgi:hypothetical protein
MPFVKKLAFAAKKANGEPELIAPTILQAMFTFGISLERDEHVACAIQAGILAERHKDVPHEELPAVLQHEIDPRNFLERFQGDPQTR